MTALQQCNVVNKHELACRPLNVGDQQQKMRFVAMHKKILDKNKEVPKMTIVAVHKAGIAPDHCYLF